MPTHVCEEVCEGHACDTTFTPITLPPPPGTPAPDGDEDGDGFKNDEDPCPCDASNMCTQCPIQLVELPIYGLGRVGVAKPTGIVLNTPANTGPTYSRPIGEKFYELADHLGNVRMVISDIKRSMLTGTVPGKFFARQLYWSASTDWSNWYGQRVLSCR